MTEDPQDLAARFWAQVLGFELVEGPMPPGSPVWGMQLVRRLALAPPVTEEEAGRLAQDYLGARWRYQYGDQEPPF
jgi:hypothetical protein